MTNQRTHSRNPRSVAGAAFLVLGLLVLFGNLDGAAAQLSWPLATPAAEAFGVLPWVILSAASQGLQILFFDQKRFLQDFFRTLVSFWVLLFVIVGALFLRAAFASKT
jgi:hypothetical protein